MGWPDLEGRMLRDGVDVDAVLGQPLYVLVGLLMSYAIDDLVSADRPRLIARHLLLWQLAHPGEELPTPEELADDLDGQDTEQRWVSTGTVPAAPVAARKATDPIPDHWGMDARSIADNERAASRWAVDQ